ncbi:hydantoinase/oxoprolinase family protein [Starkeya sp. 3C]|uniref:Hydantoinase/oxoprolinase family protein n=1 Tax=Ancylobacter moscoviensis TaxID=2597768 RepID=A0ABY3DW31_9HYPH|nr:hydantoinase/oxoprolinase family protein [Ancylobacter moscoviensis]TSJ63964.1 hydantoinase/oxoprolinase family protein [Ancylobacter moscoviensis]
MSRKLRLGVDIGGTFTDLVLADVVGVLATEKVLTNPRNPIVAIVEGVERLLAQAGSDASEIVDTVHGTTLVTNAVIEGKGAKTALVTTKGFRDVLEIGREWRYDIYDIDLDPPPILIERGSRYEIEERVLASGEMRVPAEAPAIEQLARTLPADLEALAVCFLHSYVNPANERKVRDQLQELRPGLAISISSDVAPEIREVERMSTTIVNAYVQPLVRPYLSQLREGLSGAGVEGNLYVFLSNGGVVTAEQASDYPVRIVESGPAAGVTGAAMLSRHIDEEHVVALDMGGTTAKICFIDHGQPTISRDFEVARAYRFKPGSGIPLKVASVELLEIGAGGGSIAGLSEMGLLRVGPASAGANPGPVSYGLGGTEPTVTDADLVLGYLNPDYFLGGRMKLDLDGATSAIGRVLGASFEGNAVRAAWGIHRVVNENMANALRVHAAERGVDTARYALLASGGASGLHACRVAEAVRVDRVICPRGASVFSANGMLMAPLTFDFVRTRKFALDTIDWDQCRRLYDDMKAQAVELMEKSRIKAENIEFKASCDMRIVGQGYEIEVPFSLSAMGPDTVDTLSEGYQEIYLRLYGRMTSGLGVEVLNWRLTASGPRPDSSVAFRRAAQTTGEGKTRLAYFPETGQVETPVLARPQLALGTVVPGPAIFEEPDTTVIVPPNWTAQIDQDGNLIIDRKREARQS